MQKAPIRISRSFDSSGLAFVFFSKDVDGLAHIIQYVNGQRSLRKLRLNHDLPRRFSVVQTSTMPVRRMKKPRIKPADFFRHDIQPSHSLPPDAPTRIECSFL